MAETAPNLQPEAKKIVKRPAEPRSIRRLLTRITAGVSLTALGILAVAEGQKPNTTKERPSKEKVVAKAADQKLPQAPKMADVKSSPAAAQSGDFVAVDGPTNSVARADAAAMLFKKSESAAKAYQIFRFDDVKKPSLGGETFAAKEVVPRDVIAELKELFQKPWPRKAGGKKPLDIQLDITSPDARYLSGVMKLQFNQTFNVNPDVSRSSGRRTQGGWKDTNSDSTLDAVDTPGDRTFTARMTNSEGGVSGQRVQLPIMPASGYPGTKPPLVNSESFMKIAEADSPKKDTDSDYTHDRGKQSFLNESESKEKNRGPLDVYGYFRKAKADAERLAALVNPTTADLLIQMELYLNIDEARHRVSIMEERATAGQAKPADNVLNNIFRAGMAEALRLRGMTLTRTHLIMSDGKKNEVPAGATNAYFSSSGDGLTIDLIFSGNGNRVLGAIRLPPKISLPPTERERMLWLEGCPKESAERNAWLSEQIRLAKNTVEKTRTLMEEKRAKMEGAWSSTLETILFQRISRVRMLEEELVKPAQESGKAPLKSGLWLNTNSTEDLPEMKLSPSFLDHGSAGHPLSGDSPGGDRWKKP